MTSPEIDVALDESMSQIKEFGIFSSQSVFMKPK